MSATITVATPPTTAEVAVDLASWMGGQSGVLTDFNQGSQVRTDSEAIGSVIEMQSVIAQAQAFQAMVYAAWAAFNIIPAPASAAVVPVTFVTGTGASPPLIPFSLLIPTGTLIQSVGGIQFTTLTDVIMASGTSSVGVVAQAVIAGSTGNVPTGSITQIASSLPYPLQVRNAAPATGGIDIETPPQTMARFTAVVSSIGRADPVSVANACIGVTVTGTSEKVVWSTCYEPWIIAANQGLTLVPGFQVYVDNGSGAASPALLAAVGVQLNGSQARGQEGYRPAGVPYTVNAVQPVNASVTVSGVAVLSGLDAALNAAVTSAVTVYFAGLAFGQAATLTSLIAVVANQVAGNVTTLNVVLNSAAGVAVPSVTPPGTGRVILSAVTVAFT
jgi:uncharacterized phage protein gp47/JayE